jgi:hypothetical protein
MKKLLLVILIPIFWVSCDGLFDPDEPELPAVTTSGKNTFGCKVEGNVFVPYRDSYPLNPGIEELSGSLGNDDFYYAYINAENENWKNGNKSCNYSWIGINIDLDSLLTVTGSAILYFEECGQGEGYFGNKKGFKANLSNNASSENHFEILKFEIPSGRYALLSIKFQAIAISEDGETRKITDGRADLKLQKIRW